MACNSVTSIQGEPPSSHLSHLPPEAVHCTKTMTTIHDNLVSNWDVGTRTDSDTGTEQSKVHPEGNTVSAPDERQEFFAGLWIFPEYPQHCAGHCFTVHFLHPTHDHAHMPRRNQRRVRAPGTLLGKSKSHRERCFLHGPIQFHKTSTTTKGISSTSDVEESHPQPLSSAFSPLIPGNSHLPKTCLLLVPSSALLEEAGGAQSMDLGQWGQLLTATSPQRIRQCWL